MVFQHFYKMFPRSNMRFLWRGYDYDVVDVHLELVACYHEEAIACATLGKKARDNT